MMAPAGADGRRMGWFPGVDSNHEWQDQNLRCYQLHHREIPSARSVHVRLHCRAVSGAQLPAAAEAAGAGAGVAAAGWNMSHCAVVTKLSPDRIRSFSWTMLAREVVS